MFDEFWKIPKRYGVGGNRVGKSADLGLVFVAGVYHRDLGRFDERVPRFRRKATT